MKQMDTLLFQQSQSIDEIKNRLSCIETGSFSESGDLSGLSGLSGLSEPLDLEQIKYELTSDTEFVSGIVDNIINNSNLSEIIAQIDTVQAENRELRDLLHAQQKTINEMNIMLLKLISQSLSVVAPAPVVQTNAVSASSPSTHIECEVVDDAANDAADDDATNDDATNDGTGNIQLEVVDSSNMQTVD
jgi:hypothetical protein